MTVLIKGDRLLAVGRKDAIGVPHGAHVIPLPGKYVIPGLCDMHLHIAPREDVYPALLVANGITTVREMNGSPWHHHLRRSIEGGRLVGPRWTISSRIVDGAPSLWDGLPQPHLSVTSEKEARQAVRAAKAEGADLVKVYSRLPAGLFRVIAAEARRQGLPFAGHVPDLFDAREASDLGMRTFEHMYGLFLATARQERELRRAVARVRLDAPYYNDWFRRLHAIEWKAAAVHDRDKAARLFEQLARNGTWQTPTITMYRGLDTPAEARPPADQVKYLPASEGMQMWDYVAAEVYLRGRTPEETAQRKELFWRRIELVGALKEAGVPVLAGTDTGTAYVAAGFALHDELVWLTKAGFSSMEALQAATVEPARALGVAHERGTLTRGKAADMVVLDANPLTDIRNTRRVNAVVTRGRYIAAQARAALLADVERAAAKPVPTAQPAGHGCACHGPLVTAQDAGLRL
ncbi:amidohydrolase family protein [Nonomuraea sp. NPDC050783]|uniref:amidohydrolase family protein n=1 Tax=Nonomuraea sp. NPDC050783 TaxID=3154634 RepID=UPI003465D25B